MSATPEQPRPRALVTGVSSGIGFHLARELLSREFDVVICSQNSERLQAGRQDLSQFGTVDCHAADLSLEAGVNALYRASKAGNRALEGVFINAAVGVGGVFSATDLQRELQMIDLNVRGVVQLTKLVLGDMLEQGHGKLLFVSAAEAVSPDPFEAVYGASKAFVRLFAEAIRNELKETGIGITVLMPGPTATNFHNRAGMLDTPAGEDSIGHNPADVAKLTIEGLLRGEHRVVPGLVNKLHIAGQAVMSDEAAADHERGEFEPRH